MPKLEEVQNEMEKSLTISIFKSGPEFYNAAQDFLDTFLSFEKSVETIKKLFAELLDTNLRSLKQFPLYKSTR